MASEERISLSYEIQAFAYRNVLRIIKEKGCGYEEAWDVFKKEFVEKMTARLEQIEEVDRRNQQHSDEQEMDGNRSQHCGLCENYRTQRELRPGNDSSEGA